MVSRRLAADPLARWSRRSRGQTRHVSVQCIASGPRSETHRAPDRRRSVRSLEKVASEARMCVDGAKSFILDDVQQVAPLSAAARVLPQKEVSQSAMRPWESTDGGSSRRRRSGSRRFARYGQPASAPRDARQGESPCCLERPFVGPSPSWRSQARHSPHRAVPTTTSSRTVNSSRGSPASRR